MICAFTGHRPERLPWGADEQDARCAALKALLAREVRALLARGCTQFLCGMARGCDLYFAEAVLAVPGAPLTAMLPCPSQPDRWPQADRERYYRLLLRCSEVRLLEQTYSPGCMLRRNRAMVDAADALLTVFDGAEGGTAATIRYARRLGREIIPLWL